MIDWLLDNHRSIVARSRWILAGCAFGLLALTKLPPNELDRWIARTVVAAIVAIVAVWAVLAVLNVIHPRLLDEAQRRRAERR